MNSKVCQECKTENSSTAEFCKKCGANILDNLQIKKQKFNENNEGKRYILRKFIVFAIITIIIVGFCIGSGIVVDKAGLFNPITPTITRTRMPTSTPKSGKLITTWPTGSGYLIAPKHKPSEPYTIYTFATEWEIWSIYSGNIEAHGEIEYINSKNMAFAPGAKITNRNRQKVALDIPDINGDECRLSYGMTVEVDRYGQFTPYWYYPEMPPPT
jgi:ribosomal protein L40E